MSLVSVALKRALLRIRLKADGLQQCSWPDRTNGLVIYQILVLELIESTRSKLLVDECV